MTEQITDGQTQGVSPKAIVAAALPGVAGLVLAILDLTGVIEVDDAVWIALLGGAGLAGGGAAAASTGTVKAKE